MLQRGRLFRVSRLALAGACAGAALLVMTASAAIRAASPSPGESGAAVELGDWNLVADTRVGDGVAAGMTGIIHKVRDGAREPLVSRPGLAVTHLEKARFGPLDCVAVGWTSGGTGRYLEPEVWARGSSGTLERVWGAFGKTPLHEGEMTLSEVEGEAVLDLRETLAHHSSAPPLSGRTWSLRWKDGGLRLEGPVYEPPETTEQMANVAHARAVDGDDAGSVRLYEEALEGGALDGSDPYLAAEVRHRIAESHRKLGAPERERQWLEHLIELYPESELARQAADRLLEVRASDLKERRP